jgi:hypothetical protein
VTIPLAPRTARAIDLAIGERAEGPFFVTGDGRRLDRHCAGRIVRRIARRAGIAKLVGRTRCATHSSPPPSMLESRYATYRKPPHTPTRAPPCATTELEPRSTDMPPISLPPTSPEPPGKKRAARPTGRNRPGGSPMAKRDHHNAREPPLCRFFVRRLSADAGMRNRVICVGIRSRRGYQHQSRRCVARFY